MLQYLSLLKNPKRGGNVGSPYLIMTADELFDTGELDDLDIDMIMDNADVADLDDSADSNSITHSRKSAKATLCRFISPPRCRGYPTRSVPLRA